MRNGLALWRGREGGNEATDLGAGKSVGGFTVM